MNTSNIIPKLIYEEFEYLSDVDFYIEMMKVKNRHLFSDINFLDQFVKKFHTQYIWESLIKYTDLPINEIIDRYAYAWIPYIDGICYDLMSIDMEYMSQKINKTDKAIKNIRRFLEIIIENGSINSKNAKLNSNK